MELAQATARAELLKASSENESAKATEAIEEQQLNEYRKQKEKTVIPAAQGGIVAYANDVYFDASRQIREGATVYFQQKVFSLPDMSHMQVKVNTHESLVKKIKSGQPAEIRIDAFASTVFTGKVKSVSHLADSTRPWTSTASRSTPPL